MTAEGLVTTSEGTSLKQAEVILQKNKIDKFLSHIIFTFVKV